MTFAPTPRLEEILSYWDSQRLKRGEETDSVAGVRGLELRNVAFQSAGQNSLVSQSIFVPETFCENCERADRRLGARLGAATVSG